MIGLEIAPFLEAAAKQRKVEGGKQAGRGRLKKVVPTEGQPKAKRAPRVVDQVGKAAGVGHGTVSKAKKVPTLRDSRWKMQSRDAEENG